MTNFEQRKVWRVKLNDKRNEDHDHSKARYIRDSKVINRAMKMFHIEGRMARWGGKE
jgi:hypothetical protein